MVSRACWALLVGFGVLLLWVDSRFGEVYCGWLCGMFVGLLMVMELLWVCVSVSLCMCLVMLVVVGGTRCTWVWWVCLFLLGSGEYVFV